MGYYAVLRDPPKRRARYQDAGRMLPGECMDAVLRREQMLTDLRLSPLAYFQGVYEAQGHAGELPGGTPLWPYEPDWRPPTGSRLAHLWARIERNQEFWLRQAGKAREDEDARFEDWHGRHGAAERIRRRRIQGLVWEQKQIEKWEISEARHVAAQDRQNEKDRRMRPWIFAVREVRQLNRASKEMP